MPPDKDLTRLIDAAMAGRKNAYCPYSGYYVGAAVLTPAGEIFSGCNVENASYGLSICAERTAIFNAVAHGQKILKAVCVAAESALPCGACRQVMREFSNAKTALYLANLNGARRVTKTTVFKMLPGAFDGEALKRKSRVH